jgi:hypothetical protein
VPERMRENGLVHHEIRPHKSGDRAAVLLRGGRLETDQPGGLSNVPLPADPCHRRAPAHQEPVADLLRGRGVRRAASAVHQREDSLSAAIGDFEKKRPARSRRVLRLQDVEVRRELDLPRRVPRSQAEVHDGPIV